MEGAYQATQEPLLLGQGVTGQNFGLHKARLLRNGLAVTAFASFEAFIRDRLAEVAAWLTSQEIPYSAYPDGMRNASRTRGLKILNSLNSRKADPAEIDKAFMELGESWSRAENGVGWVVPHVSLLWEGSNLSAQVSLEIVTAFGAASKWEDLSTISKGAGFQTLPSKSLFDEIAQRRHSSAHQANYNADILLLRTTPGNLVSFGFAFDALISSAARSIAVYSSPEKGRAAIHLTILDQVNGVADEWQETRGFVDDPHSSSVRRKGTQEEVVADCKARLRGPRDVLVVRHWDGVRHQVKNWHTMGI